MLNETARRFMLKILFSNEILKFLESFPLSHESCAKSQSKTINHEMTLNNTKRHERELTTRLLSSWFVLFSVISWFVYPSCRSLKFELMKIICHEMPARGVYLLKAAIPTEINPEITLRGALIK
ncbi:MAG TPA: hypothetical protein VGC66_02675 [Pyrinomonadaceae bacterium]|jgi:hypothetical protein